MRRILFLEDEPTIREVLAEYMKMQRYEVTEACDGDEAVALLKSQNFDLAVLDIIVPKRSGLEVLAYIRQEYPDMAVIMLTALDDEQTQVKAFNAYADDYVIKPVSPLILLKRMETILRRTTHNRTSPGIKDQTDRAEQGLSIDQDAYQAYYDGQALPLTLSEYLLLSTLYQEPQRVFTREQLILRIFNEEYIGNDRIIDAHVKNLRKKLPMNLIKTVIGVGYQYASPGERMGGIKNAPDKEDSVLQRPDLGSPDGLRRSLFLLYDAIPIRGLCQKG